MAERVRERWRQRDKQREDCRKKLVLLLKRTRKDSFSVKGCKLQKPSSEYRVNRFSQPSAQLLTAFGAMKAWALLLSLCVTAQALRRYVHTTFYYYKKLGDHVCLKDLKRDWLLCDKLSEKCAASFFHCCTIISIPCFQLYGFLRHPPIYSSLNICVFFFFFFFSCFYFSKLLDKGISTSAISGKYNM